MMENTRSASASLHHFIRAAIIMGFAMYIVYLVKSGNLIYYIAPRMEGYVKYAAVGLYVVAAYKVYIGVKSLWGTQESCDCDHSPSPSFFRNTVAYSLFIIPLLMGFLMPNTALSSAAANKKGMNLTANTALNKPPKQLAVQTAALSPGPSGASKGDASQTPAVSGTNAASSLGNTAAASAGPAPVSGASVTDDQLKKMFVPPDHYSDDLSQIGMYLYKQNSINVKPEAFLEILSSVDMFKQNFYGKKIEVTGFVYRQDDFKPNQIAVGRFAVSCCSADATPFGILTEFPNANALAKDTWVKVTGTVEKGSYNGDEVVQLHATKIEKIKAPESPYVYPNMDAVTEVTKK